MAPASAPARRSRMNCGSQPLRAEAQPDSMSAQKNSWRTQGCSPASAFHSCGSTPARESTTAMLSKAPILRARSAALQCLPTPAEEPK